MYYAVFKDVEDSDVAAFQTKEERDAWVDFKDELSLVLNTTRDNCVFDRSPASEEEVAEKIRSEDTLHIIDSFNERQEWYIGGE